MKKSNNNTGPKIVYTVAPSMEGLATQSAFQDEKVWTVQNLGLVRSASDYTTAQKAAAEAKNRRQRVLYLTKSHSEDIHDLSSDYFHVIKFANAGLSTDSYLASFLRLMKTQGFKVWDKIIKKEKISLGKENVSYLEKGVLKTRRLPSSRTSTSTQRLSLSP